MPTKVVQYGVTLLEALVAMFVLALGMMTYVAVDARLRMNSDVAKQRSEAVRLAQEDLENLRAFGTLRPNGTPDNFAYSQITSGNMLSKSVRSTVVTTTNATYTITRTVVDSTSAKMKDVRIQVGWKDRTGTDQSVALRSLVAAIDPRLAIALAIPPTGSPVRDVLGRDVVIPIPAKNLGNGTSAFKPVSSGARAYIVNNDNGNVTFSCTVADATTTTANLNSGVLANCTGVTAYLLSGYVRFCYSMNSVSQIKDCAQQIQSSDNPPQYVAGTNAPNLSIRIDLNATPPTAGTQGSAALLAAGSWPTVNGAIGATTGYATAPECSAEYLKTVLYSTTTSTGQIPVIVPFETALTPAAIAPHAGISNSTTITSVMEPEQPERYVRYVCVVFPIDLDADASTPSAWTGRAAIWPISWNLGTDGSTYKVCRYSSDYNGNGYVSDPPAPYAVGDTRNISRIDNAEHPYAYLNTSTGLNEQDYVVIQGDKACPTDGDVEVDGRGAENYTNETTVLHQP